MENMNDKPISLSSDSEINGSSHLVRKDVSSSSNRSYLITNQSAREVILVSNDSDSKKLSIGSPVM